MYAKQLQQPPDFGVLKAVKKDPQIDVFELRKSTFWSKRAQVAFLGSKTRIQGSHYIVRGG